MDHLATYIPPLAAVAEKLQVDSQWSGLALAALASLIAVYGGYLYIQCRREAPVSFNVPIPPEVRPDWVGRKWEDVQGEDRKLLEGQARGVSWFLYIYIYVNLSFSGPFQLEVASS